MKKLHRIIGGIFLIIIGLGITGFSLYVRIQSYPVEEGAIEVALEQSPDVSLAEKFGYYMIEPVESERSLIYYPGGLVYPDSYIPNALDFAQEYQVTVYIAKVPFNAAIFGIWMGDWIAYREQLESFWVGGHSLGGIAACRYTNNNKDTVQGLLLQGSYCDRDISNFMGDIISVMGDNDQIINRDNYEQAKSNLPDTVKIIEIEGLNHSAFGSYGLQKGDGENEYQGNPWGIVQRIH